MLKRIQTELKRLTETKSLREFHVAAGRDPGSIKIRGKKVTDFTNWDSLNLNSDARFVSAFQREAEISGVGSMAPRASSGTSPAHFALEKRLADFLGAETALLFSSANQVVLSLVSSLLGEGDCVIVDEGVHGRVVDAATLVHAETLDFETTDPDSLARALEISKPYKNKLVVCEAVNPITGDALNLQTITEITNRFAVPWVLDESYSLGILGLRGAGLLDGLELPQNLLCRFGSLSFGMGGYAAFFAGPKFLSDYLIYRSRTFTTEPAIPPALAAALETAINIAELEHGKRTRLLELTERAKSALKLSGLSLSGNANAFFVMIPFAKKTNATEIAEGLFQRGFLVDVVTSINVMDQGASIRVIMNAAHKDKDIDDFCAALTELNKRVNKA